MSDQSKEIEKARQKRSCEPPLGRLAKKPMAIGWDCAKRVGSEYRAFDHDALLYDGNGLPRF